MLSLSSYEFSCLHVLRHYGCQVVRDVFAGECSDVTICSGKNVNTCKEVERNSKLHRKSV